MASPDFRNYIDLTIYDVDAVDIYNNAVEYAQTALPELEPRKGTLEDALLQAMSFNTALLISSINRIPNGLMEGMMNLMGFTRREATFATGEATFTVVDLSGVTIPAGTVVSYEVIENDEVISYTFETDIDGVVPVGDSTIDITITATEAKKYPQLLTGQELILISPAPSLIGIELTSNILVGTDSETDVQYFNRAAQFLASQNQTLVTAEQIENYIVATYPDVTHVKVYDLTEATDLTYSALPAVGSITIAMGDSAGALPSISTTVISDVQDKTIAGLDIQETDFTLEDLTVECSIVVLDGFQPSTVRADVKAAIESKLSLEGFSYTETIYLNELLAFASQVTGVKYVSSIEMTAYAGAGTIDVSGNLVLDNKAEVPIATATVS